MSDSWRSVPPGTGMMSVLHLDQLDVNLFCGASHSPSSTRVFGGQVAAQALVAAGRSAPDGREVHSLHAYFVRPGDPAAPIHYRVHPVRDGKSFTTRRVTAHQKGEEIFMLSASFHVTEKGFTHQLPRLDAPPADQLPPFSETFGELDEATRTRLGGWAEQHPFELRFNGELPRVAASRGERVPPRQHFWFRTRETLPDVPLVHRCAATYASDMLLLSSALGMHAVAFGDQRLQFASLDHAVWFHGGFRADDWIYYDQESVWAGNARAICSGRMFDACGALIGSVTQEGLIRPLW